MFDLKGFRKKLKITQTELADTIGVDPARISRYESGKDRSLIISRLLQENYPEITEYTLPEPVDLCFIHEDYQKCKIEREMMRKQILLMEELLDQYRKVLV